VKKFAEFSGVNLQYFRCLLRTGKLEGYKIGQEWLIEKAAFESILRKLSRQRANDLGRTN
jgi:hypothetical protein